jgi:sec-independent protein translocase protein TatC
MYLLKKAFQFRDHVNPDMEKPFLEHLEDLRIMVTQIVVTLVLSSVICFMFQGHVMRVLRLPVDEVWNTHMQETLPKDIEIADWERAKTIFDHAQVLDPEERATFYERFDETTRELMTAVKYLRAAKALPEEERDAYLTEVAGIDEALLDLIESLRETGADADSGGTANLSMMSALKPTETFLLSMKLAVFAGVVVSFPLLLYFVLRFVLPGLKDNEQRVLWPSMLIGFGLFLVGVLFAYFAVLPRALVFFFQWDQSLNVGSDWRIGWYIGFATQFTLLFGLAFELPVVVMALVKIGILNHEMMSRTRRYSIVGVLILAAVITPTGDPITLMMLSIPMYLLYEMCIWLAWFDEKKRRQKEAEEEKEHMERMLADPDINPTDAELEDFDDDPSDEGDEEEDRGDDPSGDGDEEEDRGDDGPLYEEEPRDDEIDPDDSDDIDEHGTGDDERRD